MIAGSRKLDAGSGRRTDAVDRAWDLSLPREVGLRRPDPIRCSGDPLSGVTPKLTTTAEAEPPAFTSLDCSFVPGATALGPARTKRAKSGVSSHYTCVAAFMGG